MVWPSFLLPQEISSPLFKKYGIPYQDAERLSTLARPHTLQKPTHTMCAVSLVYVLGLTQSKAEGGRQKRRQRLPQLTQGEQVKLNII